jgi:hypothetical protein
MASIFNLFTRSRPIKVTSTKPFTMWQNENVSASFPSLIASPKGILLSFRVAPREPIVHSLRPAHQQHLHPRSFLAFTRLDDHYRGGEIRLFEPDIFAADQDPNLFRLSDNSLLLTSFAWRPVVGLTTAPLERTIFTERTSGVSALFWGGFYSISKDDGDHWEPRRYLPSLPGYPDIVPTDRPWYGGRQRGQVIELTGGRLLVASYDRAPESKAFSSYLHTSPDLGKTWHYGGTILSDPDGRVGYAEPTLFVTGDGTLLAFHRTFGAEDRLALSRSQDDGRTWAQPEFADVRGHPYHIVSLSNERAVLLYGVRDIPCSIRGRLINPQNGEIFSEEFVLQSGATVKDIGYPTGIALSENALLVAYYWVDFLGSRYIEGVTVQLE